MAQQKKRSTAKKKKTAKPFDEAEMRKKEIIGIVIIAVSVLLLLNFIIAPKETQAEISAFGVVSLAFVSVLRFLAGHGAIALPVFMLIFGVLICAGKNRSHSGIRLLGVVLIFLGILGYMQLSSELLPFKDYINHACVGNGGGLFGALLDFALLKTIGKVGTIILLAAMLLIGVLLTFQTSLKQLFSTMRSGYKKAAVAVSNEHAKAEEKRSKRREEKAEAAAALIDDDMPPWEQEDTSANKAPVIIDNFVSAEPEPVPEPEPEPVPVSAPVKRTPIPENAFSRQYMPSITQDSKAEEPVVPQKEREVFAQTTRTKVNKPKEKPAVKEAEPLFPVSRTEISAENTEEEIIAAAEMPLGYQLPPVELIEGGARSKNSQTDKMISDNIDVLQRTLKSFGIDASVTQVVAGPAVTRYELQPAPGIKVARITSLTDDIALSLAAQSVRIEAPIPGKSAIGIEVARPDRDTVYFRDMIENDDFKAAPSKITMALGKNIGGECVITDLTKMPHLLIAGTTGSGKSVCINTIICSILYKAKPDEVKLMLIDPKKVEMTTYANLPHLIAPVISDSRKASNALKWIVNEMENRYTLFAANGVKDIKGYTEACPDQPMFKIVVIIDELADLMMVAKKDVEDSICRIAQLARAAGIHLVVATQRPSVDVITGLIKANIPSRIAFTVSSPVDSRTILDCGGAEKLLGYGDMLFDPVGNNKPMRVQGAFVNEKDVARLVDYCAQQASPSFSQEAMDSVAAGGKSCGADNEELDDLFYEAGMLIINTGQASTSFLQRRLAIGNPRAARLMDMLEARGVVGGPNGSKPREILFTLDEFEEMYG